MVNKFKVVYYDKEENKGERFFTGRAEAMQFARSEKYSQITIS